MKRVTLAVLVVLALFSARELVRALSHRHHPRPLPNVGMDDWNPWGI